MQVLFLRFQRYVRALRALQTSRAPRVGRADSVSCARMRPHLHVNVCLGKIVDAENGLIFVLKMNMIL